MIKKLIHTSLILFLAYGFIGCASEELINPASAEGKYKQAERFARDERYEEAIAAFEEVKNKHPYSKLAVEAELQVADIYFKRESFMEAQTAYQIFKDFHPKHSRIDYVTYQLGLSYFLQLPGTIDRDLAQAEKSILFFDEVIKSYPNSEFVTVSKEKRAQALTMLANKELYIADFYFKKKKYESALGRYETILKRFPGLLADAKILMQATICAEKADQLDKRNAFRQRLLKEFPNSDEAKKITK